MIVHVDMAWSGLTYEALVDDRTDMRSLTTAAESGFWLILGTPDGGTVAVRGHDVSAFRRPGEQVPA